MHVGEDSRTADTLIRSSRAARRLYPDADRIIVHPKPDKALVLVRHGWLITAVEYKDLDRSL